MLAVMVAIRAPYRSSRSQPIRRYTSRELIGSVPLPVPWGGELGSFSRDFALGETESGSIRWDQHGNGDPDMSTQFYTEDQQATSQQITGQQITGQHGARQQGGGPRWFRIWSVIIGTTVAVALIALAAASLSHSHSSQAPAPAGTPTSTAAPAQPTTPAQPISPAQPTTPVTPVHPVQPSAAVVKLQQKLGQLNYYEGPDDGIMGPQTAQAI